MKYQTDILRNIDAAKVAADNGYLEICREFTQVAVEYLDLQKAHARFDEISRPKLVLDAEILQIFDKPWLKRRAE